MKVRRTFVAALLLAAVATVFVYLRALNAERPALPSATIAIDTSRGPKAFVVEVASNNESRERGLMYRRALAPDAGMLFDFHREVTVAFWMKNTPLPLDMLFIRSDGTISRISANAVPYSTKSIPSLGPVQAVLEINAGRASLLRIRAGDRVHAAIFHNIR
jgi:uncharacterized membrane protein (UPF0127 family)